MSVVFDSSVPLAVDFRDQGAGVAARHVSGGFVPADRAWAGVGLDVEVELTR